MKSVKSTLTILTSLLYLTTVGQVRFEQGYIVGNNGEKKECLIENKDWIENPASFLYKLTDGEQPKVGTVTEIKEFGVYNYSKFSRASVQLDTSNSFKIASYSRTRKPQWSAKILFLKKVVTGSASLYSYQHNEISAYFFNTSKDSVVRQLVHKSYYTQDGKVGENLEYKQQLINEVSCGEIQKSIGNIGYRESDLKKYFSKYNTCKGDVIQQPTLAQSNNTTNQATRGLLNLKVTPGISYGSVSLHDDRDLLPGPKLHLDFENRLTFRAGLEAEFILPFNKNKWGIIFEPTFQNYEATESTATIKYQSIEFPIGLRYHCYLKEGGIFLNVMLLPGSFIDLSESKITVGNSSSPIEARASCSVGGGYANGPFSLEARYYVPQNLVYNNADFHAPYQRLTLIAGFRFLEVRKKIKE